MSYQRVVKIIIRTVLSAFMTNKIVDICNEPLYGELRLVEIILLEADFLLGNTFVPFQNLRQWQNCLLKETISSAKN